MTLKILGSPITPQAHNNCFVCGQQIEQSPGFNMLHTSEGMMHGVPCGWLEVFRRLNFDGVVIKADNGRQVHTVTPEPTAQTLGFGAQTPFNLTRVQLDELLEDIVDKPEQLTVSVTQRTAFRKQYHVTRGPRD